MRAPIKATVLLAVMVLASFSVASGQAVYVDVSEVQGLVNGEIPVGGTDLVIPVRFVNPDYNQTAISNGFRFNGSFDNINSVWNPAYPWDLEHALALMQFPMYFDMALATCYIAPDLSQTAVTADAIGVGHAGISGTQGVGLPTGFNDIAYTITLTNVTGTLTMDTTWWKPANYWIWINVPDPGPDWGGPYTFPGAGGECTEVYTECWPQPSVLGAFENDRILEVYVYCQDPDEIDMSSVRVNNIPNYLNDGVAVWDAANERIWTNVFIMRFLGASGFRPIPSTGIQSTYQVTYTMLATGYPKTVIGDFVLEVPQVADVNFDTQANIDDVILLVDYLFNGGPKAMLLGEEMDEIMDVDGSGRFDLFDIQAAIDVAGL